MSLWTTVWRWLSPRPRLEIGDRGILDRRLGWGWIPWERIDGIYPPTAAEAEVLRLRLRDPAEGSVEIRLDLRGTDVNPLEVLQRVLEHGIPEGPPRA